jgi:iron complex outermembrane receptor protein
MNRSILRGAAAVLVLLFLCAGSVLAQEKTVRGTVTDASSGETLPGVNVTVEGTQTGTTTDAQGQYQLEVPGSSATLIFSFVGYQEETVQVGDQTVIDVAMQEDVAQLDQVVVTGYGTQQRGNITGAQASVDVAEAITGQNTSPQDLIQGRVAGVQIVSNSGEPGAGMRIRVRGQKSLSASNDPLYVIDGVPISTTNMTPGGANAGGVNSSNDTNPLAMLNPQDIESIEILKDASATAIYGSQGSNGVVLIETKSGASGGLQATYNGQLSAGTVSNTLDLLEGDQYRQAVAEFNDTPTDEQPSASTDWQDQIFQTTFSQAHNLSFSGGTEATSFRASANYSNTEGALLDSGLERFSGRVNASHTTLADRLTMNLNLTASQTNRNHAFFNQSGGFEGGAIKSALSFDPRRPVRQDGEYFEYLRSVRNPVGLLEQITDNTEEQRIIGSLSADVDLLENLTLDGKISADWSKGLRRSYVPQANAVGAEVGGEASQNERSLTNLVGQSTIEYSRDLFNDHTLRILGGVEFQRETFNELGTTVQGFVTDATLYNNLGSGTEILTPFSNKERVDQIGFFGRANYNIQNKYLLEATVRRDGSSVFGADNKFAYFPSASVGWNIAEESFLNVEDLSQLKLRVSAGISGNQGVPPYESLPLLTPSSGDAGIFGSGEEEVIGVTQVRAASPGLKWEETRELNVGVDFTYSRFDGSLNYYRQTTDDLLLDVRVQQPAPSETVLDNVGEVSNEGIEASLEAFVLNRDDVSLTVGANASSNRNIVEDLGQRGTIDHGVVSGQGLTDVQAQRLAAGHPIGSFYGPKFVRINDNGQEVYETEDGTTTDESAAQDQFIGNVVPDVSYGFNARFEYHDFDVSAFFRGEHGRDLFNNTAAELTTKSLLGRLNVFEEAVNDGTGTGHSPTYSSRWVEDASFLRMDKLTLGYTVPDGTRFNLRNLRFYVSAQNLFVITPYSGYDPELNTNVSGEGLGFRSLATPSQGIDYTSYPRQRTFTFGIELGL